MVGNLLMHITSLLKETESWDELHMTTCDEWRINIINELTDIKQGKLLLKFDNETSMEDKEVENLLEFVSTS